MTAATCKVPIAAGITVDVALCDLEGFGKAEKQLAVGFAIGPDHLAATAAASA